MDLDKPELIWEFFQQIRRVGWSVVHDQKNLQWKILLLKVVRDSGTKHFSHPFGEKTPGHPSPVVGMPQNSKAVFPDVLKALGFSKWHTSSGLTLQSPAALA